jgi:hypothetical protein
VHVGGEEKSSGADGTADYTYITSDAGAHTFNITLTTINGTAATRDFTVEDKSTATTPFYYVWFNVIATREDLVGQTTACGHVIVSNDHFVALPATGLCNVGVRLRNGNNAENTTVLDVVPW